MARLVRSRRERAPRRESAGRAQWEERATRIELVLRAWKALVQPLHHARDARPSLEMTTLEQTKDPANRALRLACSRGTDWGKPALILGYPGSRGSHMIREICRLGDNRAC